MPYYDCNGDEIQAGMLIYIVVIGMEIVNSIGILFG